MKIFATDDLLVCPHCGYTYEDICDDFIPLGKFRVIGNIEETECENCHQSIEIFANGDSTISVSKG